MYSQRRFLVAVVSAVAVIAAGCGSSTSSSSTTKSTAAATKSAAVSSSSSSSSGGSLSGKWSGQYSGAFSGTFTLNWKQAGSTLTGTISLNPGGTSPIHGAVTGGSIKFGTVGGPAITYTGSDSGSSMSGNYNTPKGGGSWSASKS